jgi:hypothetical protein
MRASGTQIRVGVERSEGRRGMPRLRVMGDIIMRCARVVLPFAILRGVKRAEEGPRGGSDGIVVV